jgi:hypothetical protein
MVPSLCTEIQMIVQKPAAAAAVAKPVKRAA